MRGGRGKPSRLMKSGRYHFARARTHHFCHPPTPHHARGEQVVHVERAQVDRVAALVNVKIDFFTFSLRGAYVVLLCFFIRFLFLCPPPQHQTTNPHSFSVYPHVYNYACASCCLLPTKTMPASLPPLPSSSPTGGPRSHLH